MNLSDTLQTEGFRAQMGVSQQKFTHLLTGLTLYGVVEVLPTIDPRMELGSDTREMSCLHVLRADNYELLSELNQEDRFQMASDSSTWIFVRRDDNAGDVIAKLWIVKLGRADS